MTLTGPREAGVEVGLARVRAQYAGQPVEATSDAAGGVFIVVSSVPLGPPYLEQTIWLGFQISAAYPFADVYPHFVAPVARIDGQLHGEGVAPTEWQGRPALQLSRRSNRWNPEMDNAALKAAKVMTWFLSL